LGLASLFARKATVFSFAFSLGKDTPQPATEGLSGEVFDGRDELTQVRQPRTPADGISALVAELPAQRGDAL
jgi:hypothetical protein